jgi:hypothetical protein
MASGTLLAPSCCLAGSGGAEGHGFLTRRLPSDRGRTREAALLAASSVPRSQACGDAESGGGSRPCPPICEEPRRAAARQSSRPWPSPPSSCGWRATCRRHLRLGVARLARGAGQFLPAPFDQPRHRAFESAPWPCRIALSSRHDRRHRRAPWLSNDGRDQCCARDGPVETFELVAEPDAICGPKCAA